MQVTLSAGLRIVKALPPRTRILVGYLQIVWSQGCKKCLPRVARLVSLLPTGSSLVITVEEIQIVSFVARSGSLESPSCKPFFRFSSAAASSLTTVALRSLLPIWIPVRQRCRLDV